MFSGPLYTIYGHDLNFNYFQLKIFILTFSVQGTVRLGQILDRLRGRALRQGQILNFDNFQQN